MSKQNSSDSSIYTGRTVAVGISSQGKACAIYRVSSRSFPNRIAQAKEDRVSIIPASGHEKDIFINPYITYNSIRIVRDSIAVVANGSHTDIIAEKIAFGMNLRDALAFTLISMDYEKDVLNTPRIAGVIDTNKRSAFLGIVKEQSIHVSSVSLLPGELYYISTYEKDRIVEEQKEIFSAEDATQAARYVMEQGIFSKMSHGVVSASAFEKGLSFELSTHTLSARSN